MNNEIKNQQLIDEMEKAIESRETTYHGIYADVGTVLDQFTTEELTKYYLAKFGDSGLRYFLEQQIIADEIAKDKEKAGEA